MATMLSEEARQRKKKHMGMRERWDIWPFAAKLDTWTKQSCLKYKAVGAPYEQGRRRVGLKGNSKKKSLIF